MDTYSQRNAEGKCAMGSCLAPLEVNGKWWNTGSRAYYCTDTAIMLNRVNRDICPEGLCSRVEYGSSRREQRHKSNDTIQTDESSFKY
jgi:hypothetical protein